MLAIGTTSVVAIVVIGVAAFLAEPGIRNVTAPVMVAATQPVER